MKSLKTNAKLIGWGIFFLSAFVFLAGVSCNRPIVIVEVTRPGMVQVTATPAPDVPPLAPSDLFLRPTEIAVVVEENFPDPKELVICQAMEPDSLYLYGRNMLDGQNVRHALYEPLITNLSYDYQAHGLEKVPSLADGDARLQPVEVQAGDLVVDVSGEAGTLAEGGSVLNIAGEPVVFDGSPFMMNQMVVDFTFQPMVWSDGTAVSAEDSVFSYEINRSTQLPLGEPVGNAALLERTADYSATGPLSVRWTGLPGFRDQTYFLNVWQPLPRHQLAGKSAAALLTADETVRRPLATGPFVVTAWQPGEFVRLGRNPHYYRREEGLPNLDSVTFQFIHDTNQLMARLLSGKCHIATQSSLDAGLVPFLIEAAQNGLVTPHYQSGVVFEHINFGINSEGAYGDGNGRPDWFEDRRVRQAFALCTDRQAMVDDVLFGVGEVAHAFAPRAHPLFPEDLRIWPYDPAAGSALLDEAGLVDLDGDGIREANDGSPLSIRYFSTLGAEMRPRVGQLFAEDMAACGIEVIQDYLPAGDFFAPGPDGPVFGRRFDLAEFAWITATIPPCHYWLGENITGPVESGQGGWDNTNVTGWSQPQFEAACQKAAAALPGLPDFASGHQEALRIFAEELPVMPLFLRLKVSAARPEVQNFELDPTEPSELWNLFEIDLSQE